MTELATTSEIIAAEARRVLCERTRYDALDLDALDLDIISGEIADRVVAVAAASSRIDVATTALSSVAEALGVGDQPTPWIESTRDAILAEISEIRLGVAATERVIDSYMTVAAGLEVGVARLSRERDDAIAELDRLTRVINTPQTDDFFESVRVESAHQIERWGSEHDAGKRPEDWVTLVAYLLGKVSQAHFDGDRDKLLHRVVTLAAVALNWHRHLTGVSTAMRPGVGVESTEDEDLARKKSAENLRSVDALMTREGLDR